MSEKATKGTGLHERCGEEEDRGDQCWESGARLWGRSMARSRCSPWGQVRESRGVADTWLKR